MIEFQLPSLKYNFQMWNVLSHYFFSDNGFLVAATPPETTPLNTPPDTSVWNQPYQDITREFH